MHFDILFCICKKGINQKDERNNDSLLQDRDLMEQMDLLWSLDTVFHRSRPIIASGEGPGTADVSARWNLSKDLC